MQKKSRSGRKSPSRHHGQSGRSRDSSPEHLGLGPDERGDDYNRHSEGRRTSSKGSKFYTTPDGLTIEQEWETEEYEYDQHYDGVIDCAKKIWEEEGLGGFYTGVVEETIGTLGSAFWYYATCMYSSPPIPRKSRC